MLTVILTQVGLPLETVGFVAGVDPILGRIATMNNVTGDLAVATVVGKWNDAIDFTDGVWTRRSNRGTDILSSGDRFPPPPEGDGVSNGGNFGSTSVDCHVEVGTLEDPIRPRYALPDSLRRSIGDRLRASCRVRCADCRCVRRTSTDARTGCTLRSHENHRLGRPRSSTRRRSRNGDTRRVDLDSSNRSVTDVALLSCICKAHSGFPPPDARLTTRFPFRPTRRTVRRRRSSTLSSNRYSSDGLLFTSGESGPRTADSLSPKEPALPRYKSAKRSGSEGYSSGPSTGLLRHAVCPLSESTSTPPAHGREPIIR